MLPPAQLRLLQDEACRVAPRGTGRWWRRVTPTRMAQVLGWVSSAAATTIVSSATVLRLVLSTGSATTSARLATNSVCANALVNAPHVIIHAVIGMA